MTDDLKNKFISRRQLIKAGGLTAAGVAGAALIGCGSTTRTRQPQVARPAQVAAQAPLLRQQQQLLQLQG